MTRRDVCQHLAGWSIVALILGGCPADDSDDGGGDGGDDTAPDTAGDTAVDGPADSSGDGTADVPVDMSSDGPADGAADLPADSPADTVLDGGEEVGLPPFFRLVANAEGSGEGVNADCYLDWIFELRDETERSDEQVVYTGVHGGEAQRTVTDDEGAGFSFHADVYGETEVSLVLPDELVIEIPINETAEGRFWQNLAHFEGVMTGVGEGSGEWACAPFDLDQGGYLDTVLTVRGFWTIEPIDMEPVTDE